MKHQLPLRQCVLIIFAVLFFALYVNIAAANSAFDCFEPLSVIPLALLAAAAIFALVWLFRRGRAFLERRRRIVLGVVLLFVAAAQLYCGLKLRFTPAFDLDAVYSGGYELAMNGDLGRYTEYFAMFSNNLGGLGVFTLLFRVCRIFGITDMYAAALVMNSLFMTVTVLLLFLCAEKMLGLPEAFVCVVILLLFPSFYTFGAAFYTDTLSLPFVCGALLCHLHSRSHIIEGRKGKTALCALLCGLLLACGALIKGTVAILLVAMTADLVLIGIKRSFAALIAGIPCFIAVLLCLSSALSLALPPGLAHIKGIPWSHWVAMSAHGNGTYNGQDYKDAKARSDRDARLEADMQLIMQRYSENGFWGSVRLWNSKLVRDFGNGTFSASDFLDDSPAQWGTAQELVLKEGKYYRVFAALCQGIYVAVMLLAAVGAFYGAIKKQTDCFLPALCLLGLMLFLMFWEASARYVTNFLPLMLLCGTGGASLLLRRPSRTHG